MPAKSSPTQLALQAISLCESNAKETRRLAESVHEHAVNGAKFKGMVTECISNQDKTLEKITDILDNHIPHVESKLGELSGQNKIIIRVFGSMFALIIVIFGIIYGITQAV